MSENRKSLWIWALLGVAAAVLAALWWKGKPPKAPVPPPPPVAASAASSPAPMPGVAAPAPLSASQVERGIGRAREAVEKDPSDASAWAMLAHSHEMVGRFAEAGQAYQKLLALRPRDAQIHADYADALGVAQKGSLQGEPARLIARALELEPTNFKALVLAGKEAFERKRYPEAITFWQRAQKATPDAALRLSVETSIAEANAFIAAGKGGTAASAPAGLAFVAGKLTVADALKARLGPDDTVFIYARATEGSRMPVALLRRKARDLPLDFALDDSMAMVPQSKISLHAQVIVGVRVSKRGDAIPAAGDLEGELPPVRLGSTGLALVIDRERP